MIGKSILHFKIVEKLGEGGMGAVYLAEDSKLHRQVSIKVLPESHTSDPDILARFEREALTVAAMNHPNIVTIHAVEEYEGQHVLVMELVDGETLDRIIPDRGLSLAQMFALAIPLADALATAHGKGIVHRDLKPINIMVTHDGRPKILDFGLAKLVSTELGTFDQDSPTAAMTRVGQLVGTVPYMAPEQLESKEIDHRADIYSFGVVLYQMATGLYPFAGHSSAGLISAILRDQPVPVHEVRTDLPRHLSRIIDHCMEKEPDTRYQNAAELRTQLQSLQQEWQSATALERSSAITDPRSTSTPKQNFGKWAVGALLMAILLLGTWLGLQRLGDGPTAPPTVETGITDTAQGVTVLYFDNVSNDPELDWLRAGLTEMLVTDLSQAKDLRITSTDRLYQILNDLELSDGSRVSSDDIRRVAESAGVDKVVVGSFMTFGGVLQISTRLQDPMTGEILATSEVSVDDDGQLFGRVDDLTRRLLDELTVAGGSDRQFDRELETVTTASVEAYKAYTEGASLQRQLKLAEAKPLFERAVEIDPEFAMALARLGAIHEGLGQTAEAATFKERAFQYADRLPIQERFFIEGQYHEQTWRSYEDAVQAFSSLLELNPEHLTGRYRLAQLYAYQERYSSAIEHYADVKRRGLALPTLEHSLALMYSAQGDAAAAMRQLQDALSSNPENGFAYLALAWHHTNWGQLDEANAAIAEMEKRFPPGTPFVDQIRWRAGVLEEDWGPMEQAEDLLRAVPSPYWQYLGNVARARSHLHHGSAQEALASLEEAAAAYAEPGGFTAVVRYLTADLLLQIDRPELALEAARQAQQEAPDDWPKLEGLFYEALALQQVGDHDGADEAAQRFEDWLGASPGIVGTRKAHLLAGRLALARGDLDSAAAELEMAQSLLPPKGITYHWHKLPQHVPIWYEQARLALAKGDRQQALSLLETIVTSSSERIEYPVRYVRSLYLLGRVHDEQGNSEESRKYFGHFLDHWGGGDIDLDRVLEAQTKVDT